MRQRLLESAFRLFSERGIDGTTLDDIADAADLTKGAIYSNFAGKDELVYALMDEHIAQREQQAANLFRDQGIERAGDALAQAIELNPTWHRLYIEFWSRAQRDPTLRRRFATRRARARRQLAQLVSAEAEAAGIELPLTPDECAVTLLALSNGLALERLTEPRAVPGDLFGRLLGLLLRSGPASQA